MQAIDFITPFWLYSPKGNIPKRLASFSQKEVGSLKTQNQMKEEFIESPSKTRRLTQVVGLVIIALLVALVLYINSISQPGLDVKTIRQAILVTEDAGTKAGFGTYTFRGVIVAMTDTTLGVFVPGVHQHAGALYWVPKTYQACPGESVTIITRAYRENWWSTGNHPWRVELFNPKKGGESD